MYINDANVLELQMFPATYYFPFVNSEFMKRHNAAAAASQRYISCNL